MKINWDEYLDHIYVINYTGHSDRQDNLNNELKNVDILDSGIFTNFWNINTPFYKFLSDNFYHKSDGIYRYEVDCTLGHYFCIKQAYELGMKKIMILENDICFIKDKEYLKYILDKINIIDFDILLCEAQFIFNEKHYNISDEYIENYLNKKNVQCIDFNNNVPAGSAGCNIYSRNGMKKIIDFYETPDNYATIDWYIKFYDFYKGDIDIKILMPNLCKQQESIIESKQYEYYNFYRSENIYKKIMDLIYRLFASIMWFNFTPNIYYYENIIKLLEEDKYKYIDDFNICEIILLIENNRYEEAKQLFNNLNENNIKLFNKDIVNIIINKLYEKY